MHFFEELEIGARREVGSFTFTAELIKKFAAQFDPQVFHLDEEAGRKSLFGGLAASGWHVGSVCMKLLVADGQRQIDEAAARGEEIAIWGPSPASSNRSGCRTSVRNGGLCKPATAVPISAANRCSRYWRPPSCRGGMPAEEPTQALD
jgi:hypothetical protein